MDKRKRLSKVQENEWAERWGGEVTPGSGNGVLYKGDVRTTKELLELKYTFSMQFTVSIKDLIKINTHAILDDRTGVYGIEFLPSHARYVIMMEEDVLSMRSGT